MRSHILFVTVLSEAAVDHLILALYKKGVKVSPANTDFALHGSIAAIYLEVDKEFKALGDLLVDIMRSSGYTYLSHVLYSYKEDRFLWNGNPTGAIPPSKGDGPPLRLVE